MSITRSSFEDMVDRIHTLPSLPEVVTHVVRLVNDPTSDAHDIHHIMKKDSGMAAKMLRLVNSVYYGLSQPVHDLEQAIVILGFKTIRSVALSISVINMFQQQDASFNMKMFWTHSAVNASICRLIAAKTNICDPELAFVIGLLKNIGRLLLVENAPKETAAIIAVAREYKLDFTEAAREVLDTDDAELGAWLCEKWELEGDIVHTIQDSRRLQTTDNPGLVSIAQFSHYLCQLKKIRSPGCHNEPELDPNCWHHLGLDKTALVALLSVINDEVDKARQLLQLAR